MPVEATNEERVSSDQIEGQDDHTEEEIKVEDVAVIENISQVMGATPSLD